MPNILPSIFLKEIFWFKKGMNTKADKSSCVEVAVKSQRVCRDFWQSHEVEREKNVPHTYENIQ